MAFDLISLTLEELRQLQSDINDKIAERRCKDMLIEARTPWYCQLEADGHEWHEDSSSYTAGLDSVRTDIKWRRVKL